MYVYIGIYVHNEKGPCKKAYSQVEKNLYTKIKSRDKCLQRKRGASGPHAGAAVKHSKSHVGTPKRI